MGQRPLSGLYGVLNFHRRWLSAFLGVLFVFRYCVRNTKIKLAVRINSIISMVILLCIISSPWLIHGKY